jgi:hypothetical protein
MSPRRMLRERKAHCVEGALLAAAAFWLHGKPPLPGIQPRAMDQQTRRLVNGHQGLVPVEHREMGRGFGRGFEGQ